MAIGTPTERYAAARAGQGATSVFKPATNIAAGTVAILVVGYGSGNKIVSSVTDDTGANTWTVDVTKANGDAISICSAQIVSTILAASTNITITYSVATSLDGAVWVQEVTGLAPSAAFDQSAVNTATGTAVSSGTTPTLAQADEIVFGAFRIHSNTTWAKGASYTDVTTPKVSAGIATLEYKIVAATTAVTADGTSGANVTYVGAVATYKGAASAAATIPEIVAARR